MSRQVARKADQKVGQKIGQKIGKVGKRRAAAPARRKESRKESVGAAVLARAKRADGDVTRAHLLNTAGQVFAELGYVAASSKEICQRAGANIAAVNYHFGGKDGLYEAVLIEAHRQIVSVDELLALTDNGTDPRAKLRAVISHLIGQAPRSLDSWGTSVLIRELVTPSHLVPALVGRAIKPKAQVLRQVVAAILQLPVDHPAVQSGLMLSVLPCVMLTIAPKNLRGTMLPALERIPAELADDVVLYALAGLDALGKRYRAGR